MTTAWKEAAYEYLLKQDYLAVAHYYEEALETEPENYNYYWYLGLAYLLLEQEDEAQATWLVAMSAGSREEIEIWTTYLVEILSTEAQRQESLGDFQKSWLIRSHLREIAPTLLTNVLALISLTISLGYFHPELLKKWEVIKIVKDANFALIDPYSLLKVIKSTLNFPSSESLALAEVSLPHLIQLTQCCLYDIFTVLIKVAYQQNQTLFAADIAELCLKFCPNNLYILKHLCGFYLYATEHQKAIKITHTFFQNSNCLSQKLFANFRLIQALIGAGSWEEAKKNSQRHKDLLRQIIQEKPKQLDSGIGSSFICITGLLSYLEDNPQESRYFQNQIAQLFQQDFCVRTPALVSKTNLKQINKTLKIGYIAHTLKQHSVGWLSRWLLQHHNRDAFQISLYMINQTEDELTQQCFRQNADIIHNLQPDAYTIAKQIQTDEIDILVDLDSITLDITCQVMTLRPAPIQVTWLGNDASGLPAIDYFIADPYVLPENAQNYYVEKIWRLPSTYIAVNGFELSVPTLQREDLGIPASAVVYLSAQGGFKRHPETIRLQMQILKEVSNSYFLIKGIADEQVIQQLFRQIAESEGVNPDRLRFLSRDINEYTHRANLQIADVVLDTYPYNGATTTLETLWMEIPLVTRVGEQFAARNSYTFLRNVGVEEGIAWTDEEYVKWGIKLGKEEALRKKINSKLKAAKQTSHLWNARQFTREMEQAYQEMWINYCS